MTCIKNVKCVFSWNKIEYSLYDGKLYYRCTFGKINILKDYNLNSIKNKKRTFSSEYPLNFTVIYYGDLKIDPLFSVTYGYVIKHIDRTLVLYERASKQYRVSRDVRRLILKYLIRRTLRFV